MSNDLSATATDDLVRRLSGSRTTEDTGQIVAELIKRHRTIAYRSALKYCRGNTALADDVFQETFLRLFRWLSENGHQLRDENFPRLLAVFVKRAAIDLMRREMRQAPTASEDEGRNVPASLAETTNLEAGADLERLMSDLPQRHRLVLQLLLQDLTAPEIAEIIGVTPSNVRILRHRALASIRARLAAEEEKSGGV